MIEQFQVFWTEVAERDLEEIIDYIAQDNLAAAIGLYNKIRDKTASLKILPFRCRIVPELKKINIKSFRELIISPYRIVFKIENKAVYIAGVFDGRRDLEDILIDRLIR